MEQVKDILARVRVRQAGVWHHLDQVEMTFCEMDLAACEPLIDQSIDTLTTAELKVLQGLARYALMRLETLQADRIIEHAASREAESAAGDGGSSPLSA